MIKKENYGLIISLKDGIAEIVGCETATTGDLVISGFNYGIVLNVKNNLLNVVFLTEINLASGCSLQRLYKVKNSAHKIESFSILKEKKKKQFFYNIMELIKQYILLCNKNILNCFKYFRLLQLDIIISYIFMQSKSPYVFFSNYLSFSIVKKFIFIIEKPFLWLSFTNGFLKFFFFFLTYFLNKFNIHFDLENIKLFFIFFVNLIATFGFLFLTIDLLNNHYTFKQFLIDLMDKIKNNSLYPNEVKIFFTEKLTSEINIEFLTLPFIFVRICQTCGTFVLSGLTTALAFDSMSSLTVGRKPCEEFFQKNV